MRRFLLSTAAFIGMTVSALAQQFGSGAWNQVITGTITPAATAAAIGTSQQTFTVPGLIVASDIFVTGPVPTALCPNTAARVSAANTLQLDFTTLTAAACTPASGVYSVVIRTR